MSIVAASGVLLFGLIMTWLNLDVLVSPLLAGLALVFVALTSTILVVGTSPLRPLFSGTLHIVAVSSALISFALSSASVAGPDSFTRDHWGSLVVGATCLALAPYRPVRELVVAGVTASIFTGFIALVHSTTAAQGSAPMVVILFSITPVLTMSLGGAAFARSLTQSHRRWESRARHASRRQIANDHASMARSVQQNRVSILNRDVVPLFTDLLRRGIISPEDRRKAAEFATSIREVMVNEVNRSWLEAVVANSFGALDDGYRVVDPHRLAPQMNSQQRTALRAAVLAVATGGELIRRSVRLVIEKSGSEATIIVTAQIASSDSSWRSTIAPYFAVLRVVFTSLHVAYRSPTLTVRFTYDIL